MLFICRFMELHMSQYHRDAMLQQVILSSIHPFILLSRPPFLSLFLSLHPHLQVKQQVPAPPMAMKPVKNYNFTGIKAKTYNAKPR